jgi:hypothetical protein
MPNSSIVTGMSLSLYIPIHPYTSLRASQLIDHSITKVNGSRLAIAKLNLAYVRSLQLDRQEVTLWRPPTWIDHISVLVSNVM